MSKLFDELMALKEAYDTKLSEEGEDAVKDAFREFFEKHPRAESITWTQYTPYFNDGDACHFRVHEFNITLGEVEEEPTAEEEDSDGPGEDEDEDFDDDDEDDYDDEEEHDSYSLGESEDPALQAMGEALGELENIPEDVLESVFGDHVRITATREGFDVVEYDHD